MLDGGNYWGGKTYFVARETNWVGTKVSAMNGWFKLENNATLWLTLATHLSRESKMEQSVTKSLAVSGSKLENKKKLLSDFRDIVLIITHILASHSISILLFRHQ